MVLIIVVLVLASSSALAEDGGRRLFEPCRACHALNPAEHGLPGPNLSGLIGRKVGGDTTFNYSPVLRKARDDGIVWDQGRLELFLADPEEMFPGLWMSMRGINEADDRRALVRFLADPASR